MTITGSSQSFTIKYVIHARFKVDGIVEKSDVIGAVFGQTEGLFSSELDLRQLQKTGRIGRIHIKRHTEQDKTKGKITIPTSLDRVSTALIAASIESIERVGPCASTIRLEKIQDVREARRKEIVRRAKEILHEWTIESMPSVDEIFREVSETLKVTKVQKYGPEKLSAGPQVDSAEKLIIVEGRADVINLMRCGIYNVIAVEGTKIPKTIKRLCKEKETTAFLDGDRGGELILKELLQVSDIKNVARAPKGREVEELNCKEIFNRLKKKKPAKRLSKPRKKKKKRKVPRKFAKKLKDLDGTLEAILLDKRNKEIERLPVSQLAEKLPEIERVETVIFDGVITDRILDVAKGRDIKNIIASRISKTVENPSDIQLKTLSDIKK